MPGRRACSSLILVLVAGCWAAGPAWATIDNQKSFKAAYPGKDAKAYSCKVCHIGAIGKKGDLNAYGLALQTLKAAEGAKKLTEEDYRAIEGDDADEDGAANLQEWEAGTDLSDPKSVPPGTEQPEVEDDDQEHEGHHHDEGSALPEDHEHPMRAYLDDLVTPEARAENSDGAPQSADAEPAAAEATYVGTETCAACHTKQEKEFRHSSHARIAIPGDVGVAQGCETCHGPGSLHVEAGGGRGVGGIINPRKDPSTCFECHLDKRAEFRLPYHHPVMEGKMSCADCHNAHAPDVRPWSATSVEGINQACFKCHKDQRGPFVFEHEALREGCSSCHKIHGSIHPKMLQARDNNLCLRCHTQVNFPRIGDSSHAGRFRDGTCFSAGCHTAPHGSNFDDHLRY